MYNTKKRIWESDAKDSELLRWSREEANADSPEAKFLRGSELLSQIKRKETTAEAVALIEGSAKGGYPKAMFAMGQMFEYGWGVQRDKRMALVWYKRAAEGGYKPAQVYLAKRRRRRLVTALTSCLAALIVAGGVFAAWWFLSGMADRLVIRVNKNTELVEVETLDEYGDALRDLFEEYETGDDSCTNRVVLRFEGNYLDLSDFPAERVIARGHNTMVIQFASEEEARRCIDALWKIDGIVYAQMDERIKRSEIGPDVSTIVYPTTVLPQNGRLSWGVYDMGLDQLSAYIGSLYPNRSIKVGVIDGGIRSDWSGSGVSPDIYDRILTGWNIQDGGNVTNPDAHGTNVGGIILDGTLGANVNVISLDVWGFNSSTTTLIAGYAVDKAIELGVKVINMSMGPEHQLARNYSTEDFMKRAYDAGIVFVKASGNETEEYIETQIPEPIIVSAYDIDHNIADFSNYGSGIDVCAPGVNIFGYLPYDSYGDVNIMGGTSQASPHIAALAALVCLLYPDITPAQVELLIKDYCRTYTNPVAYASGLYGVGAPDATAFIEHDLWERMSVMEHLTQAGRRYGLTMMPVAAVYPESGTGLLLCCKLPDEAWMGASKQKDPIV